MTSSDFLSEIIERKRVRVEAARRARPLAELIERASIVRSSAATTYALRGALRNGKQINIIAEFKRASPSKGSILEGVAPPEMAAAYEAGGAAALSVLTEEDSFKGSLEDLRAVRRATSLPVLRKDFIFDEYQLYETAEAGADALLLIVAALDDERLLKLRRITEEELGMDALVEVHTSEELRRALRCGATLLGVNNRDLHSFKVSLDVSVRLAEDVPAGVLLVSESGLSSRAEIMRLRALGYRGFLIGERLMRAASPAKALSELTACEEG
jgi:indole-3-glycerol phosphate synthase